MCHTVEVYCPIVSMYFSMYGESMPW